MRAQTTRPWSQGATDRRERRTGAERETLLLPPPPTSALQQLSKHAAPTRNPVAKAAGRIRARAIARAAQ